MMLAFSLSAILFACQWPGEAGGDDSPAADSRVSAAFVAPGEGDSAWYTVRDNGVVVLVYGRPEGGMILWDRGRQPEIPRSVIDRYWERERARRDRAGRERNFGVDAPRLRDEKRRIRASDPETLRYAESLICDDCPNNGGRCRKHPEGPIQKVEHDIEHLAFLAVAGVLFVGAVIVLIRGRT